jgi:hypothetical protein
MASKLMVNAAFEARLLRPSHHHTALFGTVNKLGCPIPGRPTLQPILSSRSYSDSTSTPTPPFPKFSGSTEGSQSSEPKDKNWFNSKAWLMVQGALAAGLATLGIVRAGSFYCYLDHAGYQRVLSHKPPSRSGKIGTNHFGDVWANLHANLQSTIGSKRDRYLRRRLNTSSHANPLLRK